MRIAIIGAGLAGLTLASQLNKHGINAEVFEKSRGLGGRLATKRMDWGTINLGAQYFTARDPRFIEQVEQWQKHGAAEQWQFQPHRWDGESLQTSPDETLRYVGAPRMNKIAHAMANDLTLHNSIRITEIHNKNGHHSLTAETGEHFDGFDFLVLSSPAEQTRALLQASDTNLANTPLLQQFPERVHNACWAAALATKGSVSSDIQGIFGDEIVSWVTRLSQLPQQQSFSGYDDLWMLHFASDWSASNDPNNGITPQAVATEAFNWLAHTVASHTNIPLTLANHHCHYWRYARVAKNAYGQANEHVSKPSNKRSNKLEALIDRANNLAIIGDWCYGGRVEGAYLSALDLADQLT